MSKTSALFFRFVVLASIALPALGQGTAAPSGTEDAVNRLVKAHQAWGPAASTPHTSLLLKEASREGPVIRIRMYATGLPKEGTYTLITWPVTQRGPEESLRGVTFDESGLLVCAGTPGTCGSPDKPNDPIDLALRPVPGEPARFGLVSMDGSIKVFAKIVPLPLKGEDKGCSVEAVLLTPGTELVLIEGTGFPPNSDIILGSESEGERHAGKAKTDADGRYVSGILPYKQGVAGGTTKVNLKSAVCSPSVSFPWGKRN
ncbi:MAG: hypothetical protein M3N41_01800 [Acidobacteriota bacterium]|nr:hypothetical protein [Acidobacteriota bacterium]